MTLDKIPPTYGYSPERNDLVSNRHHQEDHVPVSIEESAYTTGLTKPTDTFRKRTFQQAKRNDMDDYDSSDIDLFDHKSSKFRQRKDQLKRASLKRDGYIVIAITLWAAYIRLYKIAQPPSVVFDVSFFFFFYSSYKKIYN